MLKNSIKAEHSFTSAQPEDIEGAVTNIKTEDIEDSTKSESSIATEVIADVKTGEIADSTKAESSVTEKSSEVTMLEQSSTTYIDTQKGCPKDENKTQNIEVIKITGKTFTSQTGIIKTNIFSDKFNLHQYGIYEEDRTMLHKNIEDRLRTMIDNGLLTEVSDLLSNYKIPLNHPIRKAVNYKHLTHRV